MPHGLGKCKFELAQSSSFLPNQICVEGTGLLLRHLRSHFPTLSKECGGAREECLVFGALLPRALHDRGKAAVLVKRHADLFDATYTAVRRIYPFSDRNANSLDGSHVRMS